MTIRVKEKSEDVIMVRCGSKQEMQLVLNMFLGLKLQPRMDDKVIVKDISGQELRIREPELPKEDVKPIQDVIQPPEENQ